MVNIERNLKTLDFYWNNRLTLLCIPSEKESQITIVVSILRLA